MKENITLRLDKDLIKKAKGIASKRDISLNRLLSDFLKQIVDQEE
jgi:predicted HicB family RNase H-like nuclease